jgi:hypothetical protein
MTVAALAAVMALGACGPKVQQTPGGGITVQGQNGQNIVIGHAAPANLPAYAQIYPGGSVVSTVTAGDARGGLVVYDVAASPDAIVDFYKKAATGAGLTSTMDSSQSSLGGKAHVLMFTQQGTQRNLMVSVDAKPDGHTKVAITYGGA